MAKFFIMDLSHTEFRLADSSTNELVGGGEGVFLCRDFSLGPCVLIVKLLPHIMIKSIHFCSFSPIATKSIVQMLRGEENNRSLQLKRKGAYVCSTSSHRHSKCPNQRSRCLLHRRWPVAVENRPPSRRNGIVVDQRETLLHANGQ